MLFCFFLKSIFGNKSKNISGKTSIDGSTHGAGSDGTRSKVSPGANGTRMKFVRNIIVPVNSF